MSGIGVYVEMCGHGVVLPADVIHVSGAAVVRITVPKGQWREFHRRNDLIPGFHLSDFPKPGFWRDDLGVYVVPKAQLTKARQPRGGRVA